jgi:hypothetical protein
MPLEITEIDKLILSHIVYLDLDTSQKEAAREGLLTIGQLVKDNQKLITELEDSRPKFKTEAEFESFKKLIMDLADPSSKYHYWKIKDVDDKNASTGFVAYTFEPLAGQGVVAFRGSEGMNEIRHLNTDWYNNATTVFSPLSVQQKNAIDYINRIGKNYDSLNLTGHSLGGNIALAATVGAMKEIRDKIVSTFTYNAPGFNRDFLNHHWEGINEMKSKIKEFQNEHDFVSSILYNLTDRIIIEARAKTDHMIENHFLNYMAIENGLLKRKEPQKKDFKTEFIHNVISDLELLPDPVLAGAVNTIFAVMNGRIDFTGLINGGLFLFAMNPIGTIMAVWNTALVVGAVALVGILAVFIQTALPIVMEEVSKVVSTLYTNVVNTFQNVLNSIAGTVVAVGNAIGNFTQSLFYTVSNFFTNIGNAFGRWVESWFKQDNDPINVDIYRLRDLAARLQSIQNRLNSIDDRMNGLYTWTDIWGSFNLFLADWGVGNDQNIQNCITYLNQTADRLEVAEWKILSKAYGTK